MDLQQELQAYLDGVLEKTPKDIMDVMVATAAKLVEEEVGKNALSIGDKLPEFTLANATGKEINVYDYLNEGPLVINFYRGAWCPYCNMELRAYKELLPEIKEVGANLIAISPELPDTSLSLVEKHNLEFEILTDIDNKLAKKLGLVFKLDERLSEVYRGFGIDIDGAQGNNEQELPLPATYVIDRDGKVIKAFVNTDYTKRMEPSEALEAIKAS